MMLHRLRSVAFLVADIEAAAGLYRRYLGMESCHRVRLEESGLLKAVLPAGDGTFVELLQPISDDTDAGRRLAERGPHPYSLAFETPEYARLIPHLQSLGVPVAEQPAGASGRTALVSPASANGALLMLCEPPPGGNPWPAAGPDWPSLAHRPGTQRLRQAAVLVRDLDAAVDWWGRMFGLHPTKRFQVSFTDLEIAVLPLGGRDTFIELAQPTGGEAPSQRFLDRYGEGLYLTIYEIADSLAMEARLRPAGARFTTSRQTANYVNLGFNSIWLHPAGMMGAFTQLSQVLSADNPWPPAGEDWRG